jgi:nucleotide-binding universal stress UspA family protein
VFGRAKARRPRLERSYRRLLVALDARRESLEALEIACRLAADDHARITAISVIVVPALLPLDAHFADEEEAARRLLEQAGSTGDAYGVKVDVHVVRARDAAAAIVAQATSDRSELIVLGAPRAELARSPRRVTPDPVLRVLRDAPCRVMVVSAARSRSAA